MPKQKPDLPQGTLDMLVLKALSLGPEHGYGVGQRIQQLSGELLRVEEGTLYPALYRIEQAGWIESDMTAGAFGWQTFVDKVLPRVPMRRWGTPADYGGLAVYLASRASSYHTGDVITIDGGYHSF